MSERITAARGNWFVSIIGARSAVEKAFRNHTAFWLEWERTSREVDQHDDTSVWGSVTTEKIQDLITVLRAAQQGDLEISVASIVEGRLDTGEMITTTTELAERGVCSSAIILGGDDGSQNLQGPGVRE